MILPTISNQEIEISKLHQKKSLAPVNFHEALQIIKNMFHL